MRIYEDYLDSDDYINDELDGYYNLSAVNHFREIKYFSLDGRNMPNGIGYERGNFLHECKMNADKFVLDEGVHPVQYGLHKYRGGIIVFCTDVNAVLLDSNALLNIVKQIIITFWQGYNTSGKLHCIIDKFNGYNKKELVGAYSVGNVFKGHYVGGNGEEFDENSTTIEINGLSSKGLLRLSEMIARAFHQECVLVKDFNKMKFYLADGLHTNDNEEEFIGHKTDDNV